MLPAAVRAQFTYATNGDGVSITITGYTGSGGAATIPDTIDGYAVTSIGMNAFTDDASLTSVTIPDSVTNIGDEAFGGCTNLTNAILPDSIISIGDGSFGACFSLTNFTIPNSVTSIGVDAFDSCISLGSITIPNSVTNIGQIAFENCTGLTNIFVNAGNADYSSLDGVLFDKSQDTLIECPSGLNNSAYTIPGSVTTVEDDAFVHCVNLASITIPASVKYVIGPLTVNCSLLTNIYVNPANSAYSSLNGVLFDKAQDTLLQYPPGLTNATYSIPNSVTTIQGDSLSYCTNLVSITIPNGVTYIGWGAFLGCSSLAGIAIPYGVTNIPDSAFQGCANLTSIVIPNSVTSIGWQSFYGCNSLTNIIIPASVTTIGDFAFAFSSGLASAYFEGNAPPGNPSIFYNAPATVYYLPGTSGWGTMYGNALTQFWFQSQPQVLTFEPSFGVQNHQFGFTISWATNANVIVQACTNLSNPVWVPIATNTLASGTNYFSDPSWTKYPGRFYRISEQ